MKPVGDWRSVRVHCRRRGRQYRNPADPEGRQGKGRAQAHGNGWGESRGVLAGENSGEENGDVTGGWRLGGGGVLGNVNEGNVANTTGLE